MFNLLTAALSHTNAPYFKGPPSQSLGVDPVDPAVMRRPPRKKDAPIITRRLLYRVLFSASMIVFGTLFVYMFGLEDDDVSRREQTMVRPARRSSRGNPGTSSCRGEPLIGDYG